MFNTSSDYACILHIIEKINIVEVYSVDVENSILVKKKKQINFFLL